MIIIFMHTEVKYTFGLNFSNTKFEFEASG